MAANALNMLVESLAALVVGLGVYIIDKGSKRRLRVDYHVLMVGIMQHHVGAHHVVGVVVVYHVALCVAHGVLHVILNALGKPELIEKVVELHLSEIALNLWACLKRTRQLFGLSAERCRSGMHLPYLFAERSRAACERLAVVVHRLFHLCHYGFQRSYYRVHLAAVALVQFVSPLLKEFLGCCAQLFLQEQQSLRELFLHKHLAPCPLFGMLALGISHEPFILAAQFGQPPFGILTRITQLRTQHIGLAAACGSLVRQACVVFFLSCSVALRHYHHCHYGNKKSCYKK